MRRKIYLFILAALLTALTVLGYSSGEVAPVLRKLDITGMSAEQIIKAVLKNMVK